MMKIRCCMGLLALLLAFAGCQRGVDEYDESSQANVEALWRMIDEHYCFLDYKEQSLGFSWAGKREEYLGMVRPGMSRSQLFEVLCRMLSTLKDGHVNIYSSMDVGRNWSWKDDYPENLDRELRDKYLGTDYGIASGMKYRILDDNIGYVVYESFSDGIGEGNLDEVLYYLRLCDGLILDIRGNSGGLLTNVERLAARFTNERTLVGYISHKTGKGHNDFSKPRAEYISPAMDRVRWQKPVVVLVNRSCFSAANTFVRDMKQMPQAVIMGDSTGGGSGMPFSSELPIGWSVRFSACPSYDVNMQQIEAGIAPDIQCALDSTLALQGKDSMIEAARARLH